MSGSQMECAAADPGLRNRSWIRTGGKRVWVLSIVQRAHMQWRNGCTRTCLNAPAYRERVIRQGVAAPVRPYHHTSVSPQGRSGPTGKLVAFTVTLGKPIHQFINPSINPSIHSRLTWDRLEDFLLFRRPKKLNAATKRTPRSSTKYCRAEPPMKAIRWSSI